MKISKEFKVGVIAVLSIALLVWGYNFLKGTNLFFKSKTAYTIYPSVAGLAKSSPILINGYQVGIVEDIYFHPNKTGNIVVKLVITDEGFLIPNNSIANLVSMDFLGTKAITLKPGNSGAELQDGDTLSANLETSMLDDVSEQILPIKEKAENLITSMDSAMFQLRDVVKDVDDVLNAKNKRKFSEILTNLNATVISYNEVATSLKSNLNAMKPTMKNLQAFSDSLKALEMQETLAKAQTTFDNLSQIMEKINSGEGTMGQLMNNDSLYVNLEAVSKDLDMLLIDFRERPKRYVHFSLFGRKEKD